MAPVQPVVKAPPVKSEPIVKKVEVPPQPKAAAPVVAAAPVKPTLAMCNEPLNYNCKKKVFGPDIKDGEYTAYECVEIPANEIHDVQKYCMNIKVFSFNTRPAYSNCPTCKPADIEPGGRYNFEETVCVNEGFKVESGEEKMPLRHEGKAVADTFTQVYQMCHSYPEKPMGNLAQGAVETVPDAKEHSDKGEVK
jgi:hypothetical protein